MSRPETAKNTLATRLPVKLLAHLVKPGMVREPCAQRRTAWPAEFHLHDIATDQSAVLPRQPREPLAHRLPAAGQPVEPGDDGLLGHRHRTLCTVFGTVNAIHEISFDAIADACGGSLDGIAGGMRAPTRMMAESLDPPARRPAVGRLAGLPAPA